MPLSPKYGFSGLLTRTSCPATSRTTASLLLAMPLRSPGTAHDDRVDHVGSVPAARPAGQHLHPQGLSSSCSSRATGQAPSVVLASTVWVTSAARSWTVRNDTPASAPIRTTASLVGCSQKPSP